VVNKGGYKLTAHHTPQTYRSVYLQPLLGNRQPRNNGTWWEGLCLFDLKKADLRQSEIKELAKASSNITELKQFR
jgi:hypothetical protein